MFDDEELVGEDDTARLMREASELIAQRAADSELLAYKLAQSFRHNTRLTTRRGKAADSRMMGYFVEQRTDLERLMEAVKDPAATWLDRVRKSRTSTGKRQTVREAVVLIARQIERAGGYVTSAYHRKIDWNDDPYGRAYASNAGLEVGHEDEDGLMPIQRMPREVRAILLDAYVCDVDMKNAHIALTADLLLLLGPLARIGGRYDELLRLADPSGVKTSYVR